MLSTQIGVLLRCFLSSRPLAFARRRTRRCCPAATPRTWPRAPGRIPPRSSAPSWGGARSSAPLPSEQPTSATVARTACAQPCEGERSAARQKISRRVRAPAFAGVTTGSGGTRNALGSTLGALQRPHATCYHLLPLCRSVTAPPEKVVPGWMMTFAAL